MLFMSLRLLCFCEHYLTVLYGQSFQILTVCKTHYKVVAVRCLQFKSETSYYVDDQEYKCHSFVHTTSQYWVLSIWF